MAPQTKVKRGAQTRLGNDPDPSAMLLDDLTRDGQSHACARIRIVVAALEQPKDAIHMPGIDSDAIITNGEYPRIILRRSGDMDLGPVFAAELD